jgi:hypothetical protein
VAEPPGPALILWDSNTEEVPNPVPIQEAPRIWSKLPPTTVLSKQVVFLEDIFQKSKPDQAARIKYEKEFYEAQLKRTRSVFGALQEVAGLLSDKKPIDVVMGEECKSRDQPEHRHVAIFALAALGELDKLLDVLTDEDPEHIAEREDAVLALRRYLCRGLAASNVLFQDDGKKQTGLLIEKYGERDGEKVFTLLHDFDPKNLTPDTYRLLATYLKNNKLAVRLLAHWHLWRMSVGVKLPPAAAAYNPADPIPQLRNDGAAEWLKLVEDKKLPPTQQ